MKYAPRHLKVPGFLCKIPFLLQFLQEKITIMDIHTKE